MSCTFAPPQEQFSSRSVTPASVETNEAIKYSDGWTGSYVNNGLPTCPPPFAPGQYSDIGNKHVSPTLILPNGARPQHIAYNPQWLSMPPHFHPSHRFIAPTSGGLPPLSDGYISPVPAHSHHGYVDHMHMAMPHSPNTYSLFHPPDYGNYLPVQAYEPFTDHSFAFHPQRLPPRTVPPLQNDFIVESILTPEVACRQQGYTIEYPNAYASTHGYPASPPIVVMSPMTPFLVPKADISSSTKENDILSAGLPTKLPSDLSPFNTVPLHTRKRPTSTSSRNKRSGHPTTPDNLLTGGVMRISRRVNDHSYHRSPRSALLEEFRNNRDRKWDLKDIFGHVVEFSVDQHGSRFIQERLEGASDEEKDVVFSEIVPHHLNELVRDVFGNYVVQKYFEFGNTDQISILTSVIEEQVNELSLNIYGCRVVQKALEIISAHHHASVIQRLEPHILICIQDAHGNHVIQKLIQVVNAEQLIFLPIICDNILELATHPYGCRVLQRCLEHIPSTHTRLLLDAILYHTNKLMKDQYGNYVIQFILEQGQDRHKAIVLASIRGNLIRLAQHKYASNVCEKALLCTDSESREILINEIMTAKPQVPGEHIILTMVKDQYANYVLQRALTLAESRQKESFFQQVQPLLVGLRKVTMSYSRPLVSMERLMDVYFKQAFDSTAKQTLDNS